MDVNPADRLTELHRTVLAAILPLCSLSQEAALECHFGTDGTFEARWVNSSAVECVHVLVSRGVRLPVLLPPG